MPLQLPNLDDRRYADLVEEARSLIPTHEPEWTNHNASDPGIMLLELFAYLSEMLIYRLNRVTENNLQKFLKLINGPEWKSKLELNEEIRLAVMSLRERFRAVTRADFEWLSTHSFNSFLTRMKQREEEDKESLDHWWESTGLDRTRYDHLPSKMRPIARAYCVAHRRLDASTEEERRQPRPGHVSVVVLPQAGQSDPNSLGLQPTREHLQALWKYLDERRTLTTRHHVVGPFYAPVSAEILVARRPDAQKEDVLRNVKQKLEEFLRPLPPPDDSTSACWPFGRDIFVSELYEALEKIQGVDYAPDIMLISECHPTDKSCVAADPIWHDEGDFVGLRLFDYLLPAARIDPNKIVVAPNTSFLPVRVEVKVKTTPGADLRTLKREIKTALKKLFHPLHGGPGPDTPMFTQIMLDGIQQAIRKVAGSESEVLVNLRSATSRLLRQNDVVTGLQVHTGEIVDLRAHVKVEV
jgi:hypothetical protein